MLRWLASYPKSGSTWIRAFLSAYLQKLSSKEEFDLNLISDITVSESLGVLFQRISGKAIGEMSEEEIHALRFRVQDSLARQIGSTRVVKTHNAFRTFDGYPLVNSKVTDRALYVVRNPLDVVDSLADHAGISRDESLNQMGNRRQRLRATSKMITQHLDTWSGHVQSWSDQTEFPVKVVRYEDLLTEPCLFFQQVIHFFGYPDNADALGWAVEKTCFDSLRGIEDRHGFAESSSTSTMGRFFRHGKMNRWRSILTPGQVDKVVKEHGAVMDIYGYMP